MWALLTQKMEETFYSRRSEQINSSRITERGRKTMKLFSLYCRMEPNQSVRGVDGFRRLSLGTKKNYFYFLVSGHNENSPNNRKESVFFFSGRLCVGEKFPNTQNKYGFSNTHRV